MKTFRHPRFLFLSVLIFWAVGVDAQTARENKKAAAAAALMQAIGNRNYQFLAQNAAPTGGRNRILTTPYTLALRGDTLDSDLPYFGRAYSAEIGSTDGGIRFISTDFTYSIKPGKKQGWEIVFEPKNQKAASRMYLSISKDGFATLSVQSINRQAIMFAGTVAPNKRQ